MSLDALSPAISGDLYITRTSVDGGDGFALTRTDCGEDVLVALVPDGAGYGVGEAEAHARLLARSPTTLRLLREVLELFAAEFEADEDVPGADLVDRFAEWRSRALVELTAPPKPLAAEGAQQ